jgi:hydroxymethylglutaryl-CoA lyase/(R)-citramalyl-CoA lyase
MANAEDVVELADRHRAVSYAGLVLNMRGYERFRATGLDEAHFVIAATESFSERNANASKEAAVAFALDALRVATRDLRSATVTIAVAFGCPFEGRVDPDSVLGMAGRLVEGGATEICLADTIGVAAPREVRALTTAVAGLGVRVGLHLHNTRNTGYANALAGLEAGAATLDSAVGGLGGCPFAPGATGNIATEDLVYLLERDGIETGVDLDAVCATAEWIEAPLGKQLPGHVYRVGRASGTDDVRHRGGSGEEVPRR